MATISTEKVYLLNGAEWKKVIRYSGGYFRIKLPSEMCEDLCLTHDEQEIKANSESEVDGLFDKIMFEWRNKQTEKKKVIVFESKFQGAFLKEEKWDVWSDGKYRPYYKCGTNNSMSQGVWHFCHDDINFSDCPHIGLMFAWGVYEKQQVKDRVKYKFISGRPFGSWQTSRGELSDKLVEIAHTIERENFFLELDESFAKMIAKVYVALGELTPDKLIQLTESKMKLLGS